MCFRGKYTIVAKLEFQDVKDVVTSGGFSSWRDASVEERKVHHAFGDDHRQIVVKRFGERYRAFWNDWVWDFEGEHFVDTPVRNTVAKHRGKWTITDCAISSLQCVFAGEIPDGCLYILWHRHRVDQDKEGRARVQNLIDEVPRIDCTRFTLTNRILPRTLVNLIVQYLTLSRWSIERNELTCPRCDTDGQKEYPYSEERAMKFRCYHCIQTSGCTSGCRKHVQRIELYMFNEISKMRREV